MDFASSQAVIVGINAYGQGVPCLRSAVHDAERLAEILRTTYSYKVTSLLDSDASCEGLRRWFEEVLPNQVADNDRLLVYFAGHGIALDGEDGPRGYLLPQDARRDDRDSFLPMETFHGWLGNLRCRHLLVILDCCFAGAFRWAKGTRQVRPVQGNMHRERYERYIRNPARQLIASTAYDQEALDVVAGGDVLGRRRSTTDTNPHSPFARVLFEGLEGKGDLVRDGVITAYELAAYLRDQVSLAADTARHEQLPSISPLGRDDSGEFIFLLPGYDPADLPPAPELSAENNPYRGLEIYEEAHAGLFFGRDLVVKELAEAVARQPLTLVLGASGTGKSSLVRAGLLTYPTRCAAAAGASPAEANDAVLFGAEPAAGGVFQRIVLCPADAPAAPVRGLMARLGVALAEPDASPSEARADAAPEATAGWFWTGSPQIPAGIY
jgi:hypothetical protein